MDGHLRGCRTLADLVAITALFLILSACGGGGGGGGGGVNPASGKVSRIVDRETEDATPDTQTAPPNDTTTPANPGDYQFPPTPDAGTPLLTDIGAGEAPQQTAGAAVLRWNAPTQRADGQSLAMSEIAGYRIYYGTRSGEYDAVLPVNSPYTFSMKIQSLPVGTYYFVMTTVDTNGLESSYSEEATRNINPSS